MRIIKFKEPRKATLAVSDDNMTLSNVRFEATHGQDCCEHVYASFEEATPYIEQIEDLGEITAIEVENVEDAGFTVFAHHEGGRMGIFIPCHNDQNGYYSDELTLEIKDGDEKIEMPVDKEDRIN